MPIFCKLWTEWEWKGREWTAAPVRHNDLDGKWPSMWFLECCISACALINDLLFAVQVIGDCKWKINFIIDYFDFYILVFWYLDVERKYDLKIYRHSNGMHIHLLIHLLAHNLSIEITPLRCLCWHKLHRNQFVTNFLDAVECGRNCLSVCPFKLHSHHQLIAYNSC